ncbi:lysophospholipase [Kibdelosporangium philippinense]|uniref:Lysophospholipase n=1 Tax=Kibdelosporangium philippinense TaxID=211113 RepID=A0ABS8Z4V8_9PSEU|nr:alpha/beta fold hydrolase [Kibdelosporangium philippinense]MCE7002068.1 lysophospholipase [Kibdelosporangium philippinense]
MSPPLRLSAATKTGQLSVLRWGAGEPLVLLHPLASAGELWQPVADRLAGHAVYAPDLRGHGFSSWDGEPFAIADMADDLAQAMDTLALPTVNLLGMSMGGSVAVTFAGMYPDRVRSLILADATAWYGADAPEVWAERARKAKAVPRADQIPFQLDRWFSPQFADTPEAKRAADIFLKQNSDAHAAACIAMGAMDSRPLLSSITAPTLIMVGEHDYATPPEMSAELHENIAGSTLRILPGLRHMTFIEQPELADVVAREAL